ncbi:MAG: iron-sulfur cluster repair di-iron protein, ric [Senegalia sp. (in: firmicutes)]|uniref:iron-sulfur cluster repair di-iron protein, ric n=1 Tax=Senegalia sp. (in: firmicutes) TaxID=1924098 RepID=UPI003F9C8CD7
MMKKFKEVKERNIETLEQYVPVVERVHGKEHPEFYDVHKVFNQINIKIKNSDLETLELEDEFKELRQITDDYTVPSNTCETYEAVYNMLSELDKAYHK